MMRKKKIVRAKTSPTAGSIVAVETPTRLRSESQSLPADINTSFKNVCDALLEKYREKGLVSIFVAGSRKPGTVQSKSDLDVMLVFDDKCLLDRLGSTEGKLSEPYDRFKAEAMIIRELNEMGAVKNKHDGLKLYVCSTRSYEGKGESYEAGLPVKEGIEDWRRLAPGYLLRWEVETGETAHGEEIIERLKSRERLDVPPEEGIEMLTTLIRKTLEGLWSPRELAKAVERVPVALLLMYDEEPVFGSESIKDNALPIVFRGHQEFGGLAIRAMGAKEDIDAGGNPGDWVSVNELVAYFSHAKEIERETISRFGYMLDEKNRVRLEEYYEKNTSHILKLFAEKEGEKRKLEDMLKHSISGDEKTRLSKEIAIEQEKFGFSNFYVDGLLSVMEKFKTSLPEAIKELNGISIAEKALEGERDFVTKKGDELQKKRAELGGIEQELEPILSQIGNVIPFAKQKMGTDLLDKKRELCAELTSIETEYKRLDETAKRSCSALQRLKQEKPIMRAGLLKDAYELLTKYINLFPEKDRAELNVEQLKTLGKAQLALGGYERAKGPLERALKLLEGKQINEPALETTTKAEVLRDLGMAYSMPDNPSQLKKAKEYLEISVELNPRDWLAWKRLSDVLVMQKKTEESKDIQKIADAVKMPRNLSVLGLSCKKSNDLFDYWKKDFEKNLQADIENTGKRCSEEVYGRRGLITRIKEVKTFAGDYRIKEEIDWRECELEALAGLAKVQKKVLSLLEKCAPCEVYALESAYYNAKRSHTAKYRQARRERVRVAERISKNEPVEESNQYPAYEAKELLDKSLGLKYPLLGFAGSAAAWGSAVFLKTQPAVNLPLPRFLEDILQAGAAIVAMASATIALIYGTRSAIVKYSERRKLNE